MTEHESKPTKFSTMFPDKKWGNDEYELFKDVVLLKDIPEKNWKREM